MFKNIFRKKGKGAKKKVSKSSSKGEKLFGKDSISVLHDKLEKNKCGW